MKLPAGWRALARKAGLIAVGLLTLAVLVLSFVQLWVLSTAQDVAAYGAVQADERGLPQADRRGAFLVLNEPHNAIYPGNLVELLATTEPGVVDTKAGAHLLPRELKSVLVQSAALSETGEYRVYRIGEQVQQQMTASRQPGGKVLIVEPANGTWEPGAYLVDIPAEGMFGGRTYFQFYVDAEK
jgi:hypothetical protein